MNGSDLWKTLAIRAGIELDDRQVALLSRYIDLLFDANQRMNLTRIASRADAELLHVADALTLLPHLPAHPHALADVGSGGGVPGIPLAVARPDVRVTLIESTQKKAAFLEDAARERRGEGALALVEGGGRMLARRGPKVHDELDAARRAARLVGGGEIALHAVDLPGTSGHVIALIPKARKTGPRYPRPATHAKG